MLSRWNIISAAYPYIFICVYVYVSSIIKHKSRPII